MARRVELTVRGLVQGVFYRASAERAARRLGISGWVRNCDDGAVELAGEADEAALRALVDWCRVGPPGARVDTVEEHWGEARGERGFRITR